MAFHAIWFKLVLKPNPEQQNAGDSHDPKLMATVVHEPFYDA